MQITTYFVWLIGFLFTFGILSGSACLEKKIALCEDAPPYEKSDMVWAIGPSVIAWPWVLGGIVGMEITMVHQKKKIDECDKKGWVTK